MSVPKDRQATKGNNNFFWLFQCSHISGYTFEFNSNLDREDIQCTDSLTIHFSILLDYCFINILCLSFSNLPILATSYTQLPIKRYVQSTNAFAFFHWFLLSKSVSLLVSTLISHSWWWCNSRKNLLNLEVNKMCLISGYVLHCIGIRQGISSQCKCILNYYQTNSNFAHNQIHLMTRSLFKPFFSSTCHVNVVVVCIWILSIIWCYQKYNT